MKLKIAAVALVAALAVLLSGCGRSVDKNATGAMAVPGARGLYFFCHGPTLIYVSIWDTEDDEYEAMWPGWCAKDAAGKWVYDMDSGAAPARTNGNTDGDGK